MWDISQLDVAKQWQPGHPWGDGRLLLSLPV